jgi:hypothetical protein
MHPNMSVKNAVFWDVTPCGSFNNQRFGGTYRLNHQHDKTGELGTTLAVTSNRSTLRRITKYDTKQYFFAACFGC